jgi:hypothetical protein
MEEIQRGCFVCTYLGEPVTNKEAAARLHAYDAAGEGHALLVRVSDCSRTFAAGYMPTKWMMAWLTLPKHAKQHGLTHKVW